MTLLPRPLLLLLLVAAARADEVTRGLGPELDLVLDGGVTAGGAGSTVADCTVWPPRILRQGPVRLS